MNIMNLNGAASALTPNAGCEGFPVGSPRRPVVEARRRRGGDESDDLEERSKEGFRARQSSRTEARSKASHGAIRKGRHHEVSH